MVWDCSAAGNLVNKVQELGAKEDYKYSAGISSRSQPPRPPIVEASTSKSRRQIPTVLFRDTIQLGACQADESLPINPDLPADLFTCCLTSPIEIGLRFFFLRYLFKTNLTPEMLPDIPGKLNDQRTPLGELNWIFAAIADAIAWTTFPPELFQKLFRHDLLVAALFRGFLLAERVMRFYDCTPVSVPALPPSHNHPL